MFAAGVGTSLVHGQLVTWHFTHWPEALVSGVVATAAVSVFSWYWYLLSTRATGNLVSVFSRYWYLLSTHFVAANMILFRKRFCGNKHTFVTTKDVFYCDKNVACGSSRQ